MPIEDSVSARARCRRGRRARWVFVAVALWSSGVQTTAASGENRSNLRRVRVNVSRLAEALDAGMMQSPTLRDLVDRIEDSDLIVHITALETSTGPVGGEMQFVAAAVGARYVRIRVRQGLPWPQLIAMIGHELQHSVEVADAPDVVDQRSLGALYAAIGYSPESGRHETRLARETGVQILREVTLPERDATASKGSALPPPRRPR